MGRGVKLETRTALTPKGFDVRCEEKSNLLF